MTPGIFATLLNSLQEALKPGLVAMRPAILGLFACLALLEMMRLGTALAMGDRDLPMSVIRFLLRTGVILWVVLDYPTIVHAVYQSFVQLGLTAGGNGLTAPQFLDPGTYMWTGIKAGGVLFDAFKSSTTLFSLPMAIAYLFAWVMFMMAYGIMALAVFILQVEFTITIMAAVVMLPFAAMRGTGWIAQGAISYPINVGFRFFVLAMLASVVFPLLKNITALEASLQSAVVMCLAAWMMAFLFLKGPAIAAGILSGAPSLSAGQVVQAAAGTVIAGGAAVGAGGAIASAGTRMVSSGAQSIGSGMRRLGTIGAKASTSGSPGAPQIQKTLQGSRGGALPSRPTPPLRALQDALAKTSRYFSNDHAHGGTNAHLD